MPPELTGAVKVNGLGLAGVAVTDGRHVTTTDVDGRYALPGFGSFVAITCPTGTTTDAWFQRAGAEPATFELRRRSEPSTLRLAHITDLHLSVGGPIIDDEGDEALFRFRDGQMARRDVAPPHLTGPLVDRLRRDGPDLVVATGDVTNRGRDEEYRAYRRFIGGLDAEVRTIPGNHDLMPQPGDEVITGAGVEEANYGVVTHRYEQHLGPRWYSFDRAGLHVAVIDWYTLYLGIERDVQLAWLHADIAAADPGLEIVLLSHDQPATELLDALPRRPFAVLSGHRHTSRVVRSDSTWWISTGPPLFGGLDHTPPHYRLLDWDGRQLSVSTRWSHGPSGVGVEAARSGAAVAADTRTPGTVPQWRHALPGTVHRATPTTFADSVLLACEDETTGTGALVRLDRATGAPKWRVELPVPVKTGPLVVGDLALVAGVTGEVHAIDIATGRRRWQSAPDHGNDLWVFAPPVADSERLYIVEPRWVAALRLADGHTVWERRDLGRLGPMTTLARPALVDGTLVFGLLTHLPPLWGLNAATGQVRWPSDATPRLAFERRDDLLDGLPLSLTGSLVRDPDAPDVYARRLDDELARIRAHDGTVVWTAGVPGWFDAGPPALAGDLVLAVSAGRRLVALERATGRQRWATEVTAGEAPPLRPYARKATAIAAGPVVVDRHALLTAGDGDVVAIRLEDGVITARTPTGEPAAAPVTVAGQQAVTVGLDGIVQSWALAALIGAATVGVDTSANGGT